MIKGYLKSKLNEDISVLAVPDNHGYSYLFDCGVASLLSVTDLNKLRVLFVTHTHIDHFANFDFILRHRAGAKDPLTIVGPEGIAKNVEAKFAAYNWNLIGKRNFYFEVLEIISLDKVLVYRLYPPEWKKQFIKILEDRPIFSLDKISVNFCILDHKIASIAYCLIQEGTLKIKELPYEPGPWVAQLKNAYLNSEPNFLIKIQAKEIMAKELFYLLEKQPDYKLAYVMDHLGGGKNHEILKEFLFEVDELFIEAYFRQVDFNYAKRHHHSTAYLSGLLAREARVKKLNLVHHSRRYIGEIADILEEGRAAFENREPKFKKEPVAKYDLSDLAII